jgi:hypothetical protein
MFYRRIIDDSRSINDTSKLVRMTIISDATSWSITYSHHSYNSKVSFTIVILLCYRPQVRPLFRPQARPRDPVSLDL